MRWHSAGRLILTRCPRCFTIRKGFTNLSGNAETRKGSNAVAYLTPQELGRRVIELRQELGLSQTDLASKIGRSVAYVSRLETGVGAFPKLTDLDRLARALEVTPENLSRGIASTESDDRFSGEIVQTMESDPDFKDAVGKLQATWQSTGKADRAV